MAALVAPPLLALPPTTTTDRDRMNKNVRDVLLTLIIVAAAAYGLYLHYS